MLFGYSFGSGVENHFNIEKRNTIKRGFYDNKTIRKITVRLTQLNNSISSLALNTKIRNM